MYGALAETLGAGIGGDDDIGGGRPQTGYGSG